MKVQTKNGLKEYKEEFLSFWEKFPGLSWFEAVKKFGTTPYKESCVKEKLPYEVEVECINGMKFRDTVRWCNCINCIDQETFDEITDPENN
jgi:hypothetical protein